MSERSYGVRLTARIADYKRKMAEAKQATKDFGDGASTAAQTTGRKMSQLGGTLSTRLTLPLAAAGVGAIKMATDFDASITRIGALVGVGADELEGMRQSVLDLAGETARAPQELADALFFITSAGLEGEVALAALEESAKASAVGLGDTATVADLVTSAMNAYGPEVLNAKQATDDLTEAVRLGKLEPDQLAGAMGRVLPIASAMGVEFHEVSAAFAAMSRTGTNANEAATQLRGIMSGILSPTTEAKNAMEEMGLSVQDVQTSLAEDGLLATLQMLVDKLGGNAAAVEAVFGNVRALSGVMDMLGSNVATTEQIFDDMTDTVNATDEAFRTTAEGGAFQQQQAMAELKTAMIEIGTVLAPVAADVANFISGVADGFSSLPEPLQKTIVAFGAVAAAAGPVMKVGGKLIENSKSIAAAFGKVPPPLLAVGAAVALAAIAYRAHTAKAREIEARTNEVAAALISASGTMADYAAEAAATADVVDDLAVAQRALSDALLAGDDGDKIVQALGAIGRQGSEAAEVLLEIGNEPVEAMQRYLEASGLAADVSYDLARAINDTDTAIQDNISVDKWAEGFTRLGKISEEQGGIATEQFANLGDETILLMRALEELQDQGEKTDLQGLATQFLNAEVTSSELRESLVEQAEATVGATRASEDSYDVFVEYGRLLAENSDQLDTQTAATDAAGDSAGMTAEEIAALAEGLGEASDEGEEMASEMREVDRSTLDAASAFEELAGMADLLGQAFDDLIGTNIDLDSAHQDVLEGAIAIEEQMAANREEFGAGSTSLDVFTEAGRNNRDMVKEQTETILGLGEQMVRSGSSTDEAAESVLAHRQALIDQMVQAGYTRDEIDDYLETLGFTPESVTTSIETANVEHAKEQIQEQLDKLGELPESVASEVETLIDEGSYETALSRLTALEARRSTTLTVTVNQEGTVTLPGGARVRGTGGIRDTPELALWAEDGREAILPLTKPQHLDRIVADSRVYAPLMASLDRIGGEHHDGSAGALVGTSAGGVGEASGAGGGVHLFEGATFHNVMDVDQALATANAELAVLGVTG